MEKPKIKYIVDALMFLDFLALAFSGFVLKFILPRGSGRLFGETSFIGLYRENWLTMHDITSLGIVILLIIHLLLNWTWIKCMTLGLCKKDGRKK